MRTKTLVTFALYELLDLLEDFLFLASRPSMGRLNGYWGYTEMRSSYRAFQRWQELQYIEKIEVGNEVAYRIGTKGLELLAQRRPSAKLRGRRWDGRWRMVVFDFPETARKARDAFRHTLRQQRMGCLQKSVWITPDSVIPEWKQLLRETKLTEWVLLFESAELGPVDDVDIARKVWGLDDLHSRYQRYLSEFGDLPRALHNSRPSLLAGDLGRRARRESRAYFDLLADDPVLPKELTPTEFMGSKADSLHAEVRRELRDCLLTGKR
jgi:phenylacetic acid degradation operon negative regulatory protein